MINTDTAESIQDMKEDGKNVNYIKMAETYADTSRENVRYNDDDGNIVETRMWHGRGRCIGVG